LKAKFKRIESASQQGTHWIHDCSAISESMKKMVIIAGILITL
jgi:hypothetical protein